LKTTSTHGTYYPGTELTGVLPDAGGRLVAHEFDYSKTHVIYDENGVKITSFPAIHIMDGCVSFCLDWKGLSFVFSSDTYPNKWFIEETKGADLVVHECFFSAEQWQRITGFTYPNALWATNYIHTPPDAFGKVMSAVKPRHAVGYHFWNHPDILPETLRPTATFLNVSGPCNQVPGRSWPIPA
jgi:ribonuclease Z